jgi:hypothetical protein
LFPYPTNPGQISRKNVNQSKKFDASSYFEREIESKYGRIKTSEAISAILATGSPILKKE